MRTTFIIIILLFSFSIHLYGWNEFYRLDHKNVDYEHRGLLDSSLWFSTQLEQLAQRKKNKYYITKARLHIANSLIKKGDLDSGFHILNQVDSDYIKNIPTLQFYYHYALGNYYNASSQPGDLEEYELSYLLSHRSLDEDVRFFREILFLQVLNEKRRLDIHAETIDHSEYKKINHSYTVMSKLLNSNQRYRKETYLYMTLGIHAQNLRGIFDFNKIADTYRNLGSENEFPLAHLGAHVYMFYYYLESGLDHLVYEEYLNAKKSSTKTQIAFYEKYPDFLMAQMLESINRPDSALTYARNCYKAYNSQFSNSKQINDLMSSIYSKIPNYDSAYKYQEESLNQFQNLNFAQYRRQLELTVENQNATLKSRNTSLQNQIITNWILVVIFTLISIAIILYFKRKNYYNNKLKNKRISLKLSNDSLENYKAIVSHDLRTPLTSMQMLTHILTEQMDTNNSIKKNLSQICQLCTESESNIKSILQEFKSTNH